MKLKSADIQKKKDLTKLENEELKESLKSLKILHRDQLKLKNVRIYDINLTIKTLKNRITILEKQEAKCQSKFVEFCCQSSANTAKEEHKKELIHIKEKKKKYLENEKKYKKNCEIKKNKKNSKMQSE